MWLPLKARFALLYMSTLDVHGRVHVGHVICNNTKSANIILVHYITSLIRYLATVWNLGPFSDINHLSTSVPDMYDLFH